MADRDPVLVTGAGGTGRLVTERLRAQNTSHVTTIAQAGSEPASATDKQHSMTVTDRRKD
ncbi:hypothetical protein OG342_06265 [Streptomyces bobili]|uniref:hypothetical protein n=1 Tax=Streptomyces bobili TaxID=67280 RepID=UPI0022542726|nr:hypothetical protein [Streptomyces bobili]MCX5522472.1 hypothetical protein [Streptomyces bobili]